MSFPGLYETWKTRLVQAFGNASTHRNQNSSRFGRFVKLMLSARASSGSTALQLSGGELETYLLEKSRVVRQGTGERNFHSFHILVDNRPAVELEGLLLRDHSRARRVHRRWRLRRVGVLRLSVRGSLELGTISREFERVYTCEKKPRATSERALRWKSLSVSSESGGKLLEKETRPFPCRRGEGNLRAGHRSIPASDARASAVGGAEGAKMIPQFKEVGESLTAIGLDARRPAYTSFQ